MICIRTYFKRLTLLVSLSYFAACSKCHCVDEDLRPNFISFGPTEVATLVLKRYNKGNGFSTVLDSMTFSEGQGYGMQQLGDTITFPVRLGNFSLNPNFDWILLLPLVNRSFRISEIVKDETSGDCSGKMQCVNGVRSLKIDNAIQSLQITAFDFYIHK